jgi:ubiquinone/menaquinone biosynthesis C-methylase UbiE
MQNKDQQRIEHPSTYFVQDRANLDELARLTVQDRMLTLTMGGVLAEQPDPTLLQRVLDVGCGTGNWLLEVAREYPTISLLIGVDISGKMLDYGREQATKQGVADRVEFHVMDALRMLEFPSGFFDLVNLRLGVGYLRKWDWPKLIDEFKRVTRPGKVIRFTEGDIAPASNSPALTRLFDLQIEALINAGNLFEPGDRGIADKIAGLLERAGLEEVQTHTYKSEYQPGSVAAQYLIEDFQRLFRTITPFLRKWTHLPDDYDELYQQMTSEITQPDFWIGGSGITTTWGKVPH